ncbi:MAG: hypothetical protein K0U37_01175 [Gammaproteobacteria bacterium]|nr:hypothetical protein [Gammaproteobacteria bacterium]
MSRSLKHFFQQLPPFILLGIAIALAVGIFVVFSYVLVWGLLIGGILWGVSAIFQYFRSLSASDNEPKTSKGRIIDHEK